MGTTETLTALLIVIRMIDRVVSIIDRLSQDATPEQVAAAFDRADAAEAALRGDADAVEG
jgi:uncharacterized membrane protein